MANIIRWEPFNELVSLRDAMDRLFEESIVRPRSTLNTLADGPAVDMYETKDDVVVKASVPGVKAEDIDVSVVGDILTIKGEFKQEDNVDKENYHRRERRFGSFARTLTLPATVDVDKASAEFEQGVLKLTLPKAEEVKPKTIEIKAKK
jgi:HSP20 family protein